MKRVKLVAVVLSVMISSSAYAGGWADIANLVNEAVKINNTVRTNKTVYNQIEQSNKDQAERARINAEREKLNREREALRIEQERLRVEQEKLRFEKQNKVTQAKTYPGKGWTKTFPAPEKAPHIKAIKAKRVIEPEVIVVEETVDLTRWGRPLKKCYARSKSQIDYGIKVMYAMGVTEVPPQSEIDSEIETLNRACDCTYTAIAKKFVAEKDIKPILDDLNTTEVILKDKFDNPPTSKYEERRWTERVAKKTKKMNYGMLALNMLAWDDSCNQ